MDHNLAYACVGYGAMRALRARDFEREAFALPACFILREADPVQFCVDALEDSHPEWVAAVDAKTRKAIHSRLKSEARHCA